MQGLDFVVGGGVRVADPSTVVDMTGSHLKVMRLGKVILPIKFALLWNLWFFVFFWIPCSM